MSTLNLVFPGPTALVLCFCLSLILFTAVCYVSRLWALPVPSGADEKGTRIHDIEASQSNLTGVMTQWAWVWTWQWEGLPLSLPISLSMRDNERVSEGVGKGMGVGVETMKMNWEVRRSKPTFERPLPALYESTVPLSMAKIVISRQMQRKPPMRQPRRPLLPPSQRLQSMV